jgi:hypothetical protein
MRPTGQWHQVLRAWTALVVTCAHILLPLSTGTVLGAVLLSDLATDGVICLPSGNGDAPQVPGHPSRVDHNLCCILCGSPAAGDVPAEVAAVILHPRHFKRSGLSIHAVPSLPIATDRLPSHPRAPPHLA